MLIADSGTTETVWCWVEGGCFVNSVQTEGINPFFQSYEEIVYILQDGLIPQTKGISFDVVCFYGAGCLNEKADIVEKAIRNVISAGSIHVYSDLLAAAHGVYGHEAGIVCIMGTGSNSCFFDGERIVKNVPSLGYILGDEGSGSMLGRMLLSDVQKGILPEPLRNAFFERFSLTQMEILERVYRRPFPNRFLASLSPFLVEHIDVPEISMLVKKCFTAFIERNVMQYDYQNYPVNFAGSISWYYQDILREVAEDKDIYVGKIVKSPMAGLLQYYGVTDAYRSDS